MLVSIPVIRTVILPASPTHPGAGCSSQAVTAPTVRSAPWITPQRCTAHPINPRGIRSCQEPHERYNPAKPKLTGFQCPEPYARLP